jgi:Phage integrase family
MRDRLRTCTEDVGNTRSQRAGPTAWCASRCPVSGCISAVSLADSCAECQDSLFTWSFQTPFFLPQSTSNTTPDACESVCEGDFLFPSRLHESPHLGTRQYARILGHWVDELGLDRTDYGTHSMRRTKARLIYRRTKNLRAVQLLLGHSKLESTVRYLGIEVDDALEISEQTEI